MSNFVRRWSVAATITLLIGAAAGTLQRTVADYCLRHSQTTAETARACRWMSSNSQCWSTLARQQAELGQDARQAWMAALRLNPRSADDAIPAALVAERNRDLSQAEGLLLSTARYSQLSLPRWTLASFYLRHHRLDSFWLWAHRAFERSYGDRTALFRLCRSAGGTTERMIGNVLPEDPRLRAEYLHFLLVEGSWEELEPTALACLQAARTDALANRTVVEAVDALVQSRHPEPAARLWNRLSAEKRIPYPPLNGEITIVNPDFAQPLEFAGFDWRARATEGIKVRWGTPPESLKFELSGEQPDNAGVLEQAIWLLADQRFRFVCQYRIRTLAEGATGLTWVLRDHRSGEVLSASADLAAVDEWREATVLAKEQSAPRLLLIELQSRRPTGRARLEAEVWLRRPRIEVLR